MTGAQSDALREWITASAARLSTLDPDCDDDSDLEPLLDLIGDARVVAIGESTHRIHEFYQVRHRVFRFLARRAGFTAFVMESGFPDGLIANTWVQHGGAGLRDVLRRGVSYHFGKCQEMIDQFAWMREQVVRGTPVRFYGLDLPDSGASALPAVTAALALLDDVDSQYAAHVRATVLPLFDYLPDDRTGLAQSATSIQAYLRAAEPTRHELTARLSDLSARMRARRLEYVAATGDPHRVDSAIRAAEAGLAGDGFLAAMTAGPTRTWPGANLRDVAMADTVQWILDREPRVLIAAANGHVKKTPYLAPPVVTTPMTMLGEHLASRLEDDYVVIGSTYGGGTGWVHRPAPEDPPGHSTPFIADFGAPDPASLDAALSQPRIGDYLLDLRTAPGAATAALDATSGTHNGPGVEPSDARRSFDAIIHIDQVSPWHTWLDDHGIG